jgi:hypothetical protein
VHFNVANRKIHYYASFMAAVPILVIIATGVLLQAKKQWDWVQPPEQRGAGTTPSVSFDRILAGIQAIPELGVRGWEDVDRLDVRPSKGVVKVTMFNRWEAQVDIATGRVLQTAYRRSDLIESIHDGSFIAGDWTKLGLFLPAGLTLLLLWVSGMWMWWVPYIAKRRRRHLRMRRAAAFLLFAGALSSFGAAQARLAVDPIVGHWETAGTGADAHVLADARKWKAAPATTPFPVAALRGVDTFSDGVLRVRFKLIGGASDQTAGLAFGITPKHEYYYARYNTKDGNVALWQFVDGDRRRILDGTDHAQLALDTWHELKVEVRGAKVVATVNDTLRLEHSLPAPVEGRVGFWTKRDTISAFKDFSVR